MLGTGLAALLAVGALATGCSTPPGSPARPARPTSRSPASATRAPAAQRLPVGAIGGYSVTGHTLLLVDRSRVGLGPRALQTTIWYPVIPPAAAASGRLARGWPPAAAG